MMSGRNEIKKQRFDSLYRTYEEISEVSAKESGSIVYLPQMFIKTTTPHRKVKAAHVDRSDLFFERRDGDRVFRITDVSGKGMPYGVYPRLIIPLINKQAVRNNSRQITIADSMSSLLKSFGSRGSGGQKGTITDLKKQIESLLRCAYWFGNHDQEIKDEHFFKISNGHLCCGESLFSLGKKTGEATELTLDEHYYKLVLDNPVPLDFRVLLALKFSPLAMDIYCWVTFKSYYGRGRRSSPIPDKSLMQQFGCNYKNSSEFKRHFKDAFQYVRVLYPEAEIEFLRGRTKVISTVPNVPP